MQHTYGSVYMAFWKKQIYCDNQIGGCQCLWEGDKSDHEWMSGNFGVIKILYILSSGISMTYKLSNFIAKKDLKQMNLLCEYFTSTTKC